MNELIPFTYEDSKVRVIDRDGEPWFIAADICAVLEVGNPSQALTRLDDDEVTLISNEGKPTNVISEAGLYTLILGSRKPQARPFKRWITHEVIPQIRKTGSYSTPERLRQLEHQTNATIRQSQMRMELLQAAKGLIHKDHLEAKARVVMAQGLGEAPELDPSRAPLYTQDFLREKNLSAKKLRSISGTFGKRVKAAYVLKHGEDPRKYHLNLPNGQTRAVNAYTEADRPLMEIVFKEHYAAPEKEIAA